MLKILLVDDDPVNQKLASQIMPKCGVMVTSAHNGEHALEVIETEIFDAILMDLNMPGINGYETTEAIRAGTNSYYQKVPILAYTASPVAEVRDKALASGMNDVLSKPLNPSEVHCMLNKHAMSQQVEPRPLRIRFEVFTNGNAEFKIELTGLMIRNIRELQLSIYKSFYNNDDVFFKKGFHKAKSTITLIDDTEFTRELESLNDLFIKRYPELVIKEHIIRLNMLMEGIIKRLEMDAVVLKDSIAEEAS